MPNLNRRGFLGTLAAAVAAPFLPAPKLEPHTLGSFGAAPTYDPVRHALKMPPLDYGWTEYGVGFDVTDELLADDEQFRRYQRFMEWSARWQQRDRTVKNCRMLMRWDAK